MTFTIVDYCDLYDFRPDDLVRYESLAEDLRRFFGDITLDSPYHGEHHRPPEVLGVGRLAHGQTDSEVGGTRLYHVSIPFIPAVLGKGGT